ncbi:DUF3899 domain-containing protein [Bacillus sp. CECT 9360]|uniref:DUF3899 domain-containing protein n=1 Tax=Bacillus sp. CECT 9360 TaxID=2845821 RepID=UPI001E64E27A|nr:DUF3899 domain-containing protein [Bacillus sp. CECT 9360]CAH0344478.1 hypothetical protein BCI9360_00733 [Bacillus sp. CECT 9360]
MKKIFIWTAIALGLVFSISFISYGEITLLYFINITFYIAGGLLMLSLFTIVVQRGFFDAIFYSFRTVFESSESRQKKEEKTPLSELVSFPYNSLVVVGLILLLFVLGALFIYYL